MEDEVGIPRSVGREVQQAHEEIGDVDTGGSEGILHLGGLLLVLAHAQVELGVVLRHVHQVLEAQQARGAEVAHGVVALEAQVLPAVALQAELLLQLARVPQPPQHAHVLLRLRVERRRQQPDQPLRLFLQVKDFVVRDGLGFGAGIHPEQLLLHVGKAKGALGAHALEAEAVIVLLRRELAARQREHVQRNLILLVLEAEEVLLGHDDVADGAAAVDLGGAALAGRRLLCALLLAGLLQEANALRLALVPLELLLRHCTMAQADLGLE
mmetsp:Transcript_2106/g.7639  ORF Transcript_2106/g.7639 Transcript_2106/m.7639 type:complete len:269 (+) Transcript_2106:1113-1919(+)